MALFSVTRYLGDEEDTIPAKELSADDILKKIKKEAKARKKSLDKTKSEAVEHDESITDKSITTPNRLDKNKVEDIIDKSYSDKKDKKKKKKSFDLDLIAKTEEADDTQIDDLTKLKDKKKRKSDISAADDTDNKTEGSHKKLKRSERKHDTKDKDTSDISPDEADNKSEESNKKLKRSKRKQDDKDKDTSETLAEDSLLEDGEKKPDSKVKPKKVGKKKLHIDGPTDVGGFTVLGSYKPPVPPKVTRVLPDWLSHPTEISRDLTGSEVPVTDMPGLCENLLNKLEKNGIKHFFPVQQQVIPALLGSSQSGFYLGPAGYRPCDICVSAPTGSGKTLAFVVPIVQALQSRVTCEVRALAVLPVQDLAKQVYQVFQTYCKDTCLKVGLLTGQKPFPEEQNLLVKKRLRGYMSQYDIIVATPGRLVDHINQTDGFDLSHLRYLVIDEADRMMEEIKQDWLIQVETAAYKSRPQPGPVTAMGCKNMGLPLQKLLYSATLSQNPEKLQQLNLFQPKLFTAVIKPTQTVNSSNTKKDNTAIPMETEKIEDKIPNIKGTDDGDDYIGKYTTPDTLSEFTIKTSSGEKPLVVLHMLHNLKYRNILCFTNSVEATHRLYLLIKAYGGVEVREFSSGLKVGHRNEILKQFMAGKIDIIICSDAMARGMDIGNVNYVVLYDSPSYIQNYIHRIGRTARAGKQGSAITLLQEKEFFHFKKMLKEAGKKPLKEMKITKAELKPLIPKFEESLTQVSATLEEQKKKKSFTARRKDNKVIEEENKET